MKFLALLTAVLLLGWNSLAEEMKVGAARIDVTPPFPVLLAGYAGRPGEFTGQDTPLMAKAMVIGDKNPHVMVIVDNCGGPAAFSDGMAAKLKELYGLTRERFVLAYTHTHNAPNLTGYAGGLWAKNANEKQLADTERYTRFLEAKILEVIREAMEKRMPATLEWSQGRAYFGGNRRILSNGRWAGFGFQQDKPVDHSVPTIVARNKEGKPIAIWTSYACHCTTPGSMNRLHWDWAGVAGNEIEKEHPGATALVSIGCGADVGPQPSGTTKFAEDHGKELAEEVKRLAATGMVELKEVPKAERIEFGLPLAKLPTREELLEQSKSANQYVAYNAAYNLDLLDKNGKLSKTVPYSVTVWKFGKDLGMVFLNGEVCVDYAVRLKKELDWQRIWLNGWANQVQCYIPSKRLLKEGGYEPDDSMHFYLKPTRFSDEVEDVLIEKVKASLGKDFQRHPQHPEPDFLQLPSGEKVLSRYLKARFGKNTGPDPGLEKVRELSQKSVEGFGKILSSDIKNDVWFDSHGGSSSRPFIRQLKPGATLKWLPAEHSHPADQVTYVFAAGSGYLSEPKTDGFALVVDDEEKLRFDISNKVASWSSSDGKTSLFFYPTWNTDQDGAGLFYLTLQNRDKVPVLAVRSLGENSRRWFALEKHSGKALEKAVLEATERLKN